MLNLPVIETERLCIDALHADDLEVVHRDWGDPRVARMMSTIKPNWSLEEARAWLTPRLTSAPTGFGRAVRLKSGDLIGTVGVGGCPFNLGYLLGPSHWGKGYATEALAGFLPIAFTILPQGDDLEAEVYDDNPASARVLSKLGFEYAGVGGCDGLGRVEPSANSLYRLTQSKLKAIL